MMNNNILIAKDFHKFIQLKGSYIPKGHMREQRSEVVAISQSASSFSFCLMRDRVKSAILTPLDFRRVSRSSEDNFWTR